MTQWLHPQVAESLLADEVVTHVLRLRELLVRGDENLAAWQLLNAVPYFATDHPAIVKAREDQQQMVAHILNPHKYKVYYANNPHERPFEEQYGMAARDAHQHIPRVGWLLGHLPENARVLDLSANDGWMAECLYQFGHTVNCVDMNPGCCERARARANGRWQVFEGDLRDPDLLEAGQDAYDAVVFFETIEHLETADAIVACCTAMNYLKPDGYLFVSTPCGAVEGLHLPNWAHVESKGHVVTYRPSDFHEALEEAGTVECFEVLSDNTMIAKVGQ